MRGGEKNTGDWSVESLFDDAYALHHAQLGADRCLRFMHPSRPAIVLGSSQSDADVDAEFCRAHGFDVVRRRSGGGAVFVHPTESLWVDLVIPVGDPMWSNDVGAAMLWVGRAWCDALTAAGMDGLGVHAGRFEPNDWSTTLCFAGRGTGEVFQGERKVVGISQRRTRDFARFQCTVYRRWNVEAMAAALPSVGADRTRLASLVATVPVGFGVDDLIGVLPPPN